MTCQRGAGSRQMRIAMRDAEQLADDRAALASVVADQRVERAAVKLFDRGEARQPDRLPHNDDDEGQRRQQRKSEAEKAESLAAREQILDQIDHAKPAAQHDQSAEGGPE